MEKPLLGSLCWGWKPQWMQKAAAQRASKVGRVISAIFLSFFEEGQRQGRPGRAFLFLAFSGVFLPFAVTVWWVLLVLRVTHRSVYSCARPVICSCVLFFHVLASSLANHASAKNRLPNIDIHLPLLSLWKCLARACLGV